MQPTEVADVSFSDLCEDLQARILNLPLKPSIYPHYNERWEDIMFVSKSVRELVFQHVTSLRLWLDSSRTTASSTAAALAHVLHTRLRPLDLTLGLWNTSSKDVSQILQAAASTARPSAAGQVQRCCVETLRLVVSGAAHAFYHACQSGLIHSSSAALAHTVICAHLLLLLTEVQCVHHVAQMNPKRKTLIVAHMPSRQLPCLCCWWSVVIAGVP